MAEHLLRTLRCRNANRPGVFGRLASAMGAAGANLGDIRTVWVGPAHIVRDIDIIFDDASTLEHAIESIRALEGVDLLEVIDDVHELHIDGKLEVRATHPVRTLHDLRRVYTPGVAEVVRTIARDPDESYLYTIRGKSVAIVTNGTRVLGSRQRRPAGVAAGDGGQGRPAPPVRRALGLAAGARHARSRRDRRDGAARRAGLRGDPARGHRVAGLLRGRAAPGRAARDAGAARRPARHRRRDAGRGHERDAPRRPRAVRGARRRDRARRSGHRDRAHARRRLDPPRDRLRPGRRSAWRGCARWAASPLATSPS